MDIKKEELTALKVAQKSKKIRIETERTCGPPVRLIYVAQKSKKIRIETRWDEPEVETFFSCTKV